MKYISYIFAGIVSISLFSCSPVKYFKANDVSYSTTPNGIRYKILKDVKGKEYPQEGDYVGIYIKTYFEDSLIFNSKSQSADPIKFPVAPPRYNGDLSEVFTYMTPGDSGIFMVSVDTMKANNQKIMPWMEDGKEILYAIELVSVQTVEQVKAEKIEEAKEEGNPAQEEEALQTYFKENGIEPRKRESGLYYVIHNKTDEYKPLSGQTVFVNYTGKLMDGTVFDSNKGKAPLKFVLGRGQVILGWDEGIALLRKGEKATLYIPSHLAYGANPPTPKIPVNATLIFDVELVDF